MGMRSVTLAFFVIALGGGVGVSVAESGGIEMGSTCARATPAAWKPWSNQLHGDVTGDGKPDTVFVGQRYPERPVVCRRLLFVISEKKVLELALPGGHQGGRFWDFRTP